MKFRALWLALLLTLLAEGCSSGPPPAEVSKSLQARLQTSGTAVGSERLLMGETVGKFYRTRTFRAAWDDGDVEQIVRSIKGMSSDGLNPSDYHLAAIEAARDKKEGDPAKRAADLDILLTDAVAGMIDHIEYGRVRPKTLNPHWNVDPRDDAPPLEQEIERIANGSGVGDAIEAARPRHFIYQGLRGALANLTEIAGKGGWPTVPPGKAIKPGATNPRIPAIRARLAVTGELSKADSSRVYDAALQRAVKLFQARHRLKEDGIIDKAVVDAMNVSAAARANQVRVNLERARWVLHDLSDDFLLVNVPAFKAYLIQGGKNVWEARTMVGEEATRTPTFRAKMKTVVFNPDWTVPRSIIADEVLPAMQRGENYIAKKRLVVLSADNQPVDASSVDWNVEPSQFPYTLRQPPEEDNALGRVKFLFPNPYDIYLHDTPTRSLFDAEKRTFSHGCIRLERPLELAERLLGPQGWTSAKIQETLATGQTENVNLEQPLPVLIVYWTVSVGASGEVRYMQDFYEQDRPVLAALDARRRSG